MVTHDGRWNARRRVLESRVTRALALVVGGVFVALPVGAQEAVTIRGTARISIDSTFERLVRELDFNRRRELELVKQMSALRDSSSRLMRLDTSVSRRLLVELRDVSRGIFRTQAQLVSMCDRSATSGGYIGVTFENQSMIMRREDGRSEQTSLAFIAYPRIVDIAPGSPAEKAGLVRGDSIMELGTTDIVKGGVKFDLLLKPGTKLPVVVRRNGESKTFTLVVAKRPNDMPDACSSVDRSLAAAIQPVIITLPDDAQIVGQVARAPRAARAPSGMIMSTSPPSAALSPPPAGLAPLDGPNGFTFVVAGGDFFAGAELRRLSSDLADLTGADDGVFVVSVARGSPAEQSGLKGGDVIVRANEIPVVRPDQVGRALRDSEDGSVKVVVVRKRQKQSLTIKLR